MRDHMIEWFALTALMMNPMPAVAVSVIERTFWGYYQRPSKLLHALAACRRINLLHRVALPRAQSAPAVFPPKRSSPDVAKPHDRPHGPCIAPRPGQPSREEGLGRAGANHGSTP